jgi:hypothetical protein
MDKKTIRSMDKFHSILDTVEILVRDAVQTMNSDSYAAYYGETAYQLALAKAKTNRG